MLRDVTGKSEHKWSIQKMYVVLTKSKQLKEVRKFPGATRLYMLCNRIECENTVEAH